MGPDTRDGGKDRTDNPTEAIVAKYGETQSNLCVRESQEQKGWQGEVLGQSKTRIK